LPGEILPIRCDVQRLLHDEMLKGITKRSRVRLERDAQLPPQRPPDSEVKQVEFRVLDLSLANRAMVGGEGLSNTSKWYRGLRP
jgi:hypothetical protein